MKLKKVANKAKVEKENQEKLSKFYHQIAQGEATTLPDLETEDILEAKSTNYDRNLLHLAVWYHQNDIVTQICENKELQDLINEQDNNGDTPLHLAVFTKNLEAYRTLLLSGGDATIPNNQDELPLEIILDNKEWEDFSQRLATMTASMPPDIKLTLIPDNSNILGLPSPNGSSRRDSSRMRLTDFTVHSPSESRHLKTSLNEPKNRFNETTVLPRTLSIAEDLVDSDQENPKDILNIVHSTAFKQPKTLSQVHEGSLKEPSYVISVCKSSPTAQQNKKYGSSLLTKISSETFYLVNKISPRPVSDDWPRNEDIGF